MGSSRLQQVANVLQVPATFFFEDAPADFLATSDGLALTRAFTRIKSAKLRRSIVTLVEEIADD